MEKELIQAYANRVAQANRTELVVILYEIILYDLDKAKVLMKQEAEKDYKVVLNHANKCINELIVTLDYQYAISLELYRLYRYVNECIVKLKIKADDDLLQSAMNTIDCLKQSFSELAKQDDSGAVMQNTQQVYVGLTYSKGTLNEDTMGTVSSRGFRA